jgi:DNA primase
LADERDEIRSRINIVQIVGQEVALKRTGKSYVGLCPFHADKNPSFSVNPDTGRYKCWSCGEAGDVFTWVMKRRNVEFPEAMRILAVEAGVELQERNRTPPSVVEARAAAMEAALGYFREALTKNEAARKYCQGRGIDVEAIASWQIGYAPDAGDALTFYLKKQGISLPLAKELFLVDQDSGGGYYDKFRGRLMFPIRDERGSLVAFGGRILGPGHPKYINSSDTPLYRKSRVLYGLYRAKEALNSKRQAVLTEGYLDVIACHRAGVGSAVASLGTALSEDHAKLLKRWCDEVVILYDQDDAGQRAAEKAIDILESEQIRVRIALMPAGEDPDTLLRKSGPEAVVSAVQNGQLPMDFLIHTLEAQSQLDQPEFWAKVVPLLAKAPNEMELDRHLVRLAPQYPGVKDAKRAIAALRREVNEIRRPQRSAAPVRRRAVSAPERAGPNLSPAEIIVFRAFLDADYRRSGWLFARQPQLFSSELALALSGAIQRAFASSPPSGPAAEWLHLIEPEELRDSFGLLEEHFHGQLLNVTQVEQAVEKLRERLTDRKLQEIRTETVDDKDRQAYLLRLRQRRPNPKDRKEDDHML